MGMEGALNNPIAEFSGPHRRRPLKCNTLSTITRVYSLFPDLNPFAHFNSHAQTSDDVADSLALITEKETHGELDGSISVEVQDSSIHVEVNNAGNAGVSDRDKFNGSEKISNESSWTNQIKMDGKMGFVNKEDNDWNAVVCDIQEDLLGIERVLMNESDDFVGVPDADINFDLFNDCNFSLDTDVLNKDSMLVEENGNGKLPIEGNIKDDVLGKKKINELEMKESSFGDNVASHAQVSVQREFSNCSAATNQSVDMLPEKVDGKKRKLCKETKSVERKERKLCKEAKNAARKERKLCNEKSSQELLQTKGLNVSAEKKEKDGVHIDSLKKAQEPGNAGKEKKGKTEKGKKEERKEVKAGKTNTLGVEASSRTKSGGIDPAVVYGKMSKQSVPAGKSGKCQENVQYTRQQLMQLKQVTAVPEVILKAVQDICADLLAGYLKSAPRFPTHTSGSSEGQPGVPSEDMSADKMDSGLVKNKKRGSSSEARKEKKKQRKRKKRAELNKKLGVKRLKLRPPVLKPKVVQPCRHYLKGRCHEGENCKFSHDVIPETKSMPCCHFARQSCMKGDHCPYDHELSKYPCNNYAENGFCSRGDSCLFSHKIQKKAGIEPKVTSSKEIKSVNKFDKSNSKQQRDPAHVPKALGFLPFSNSLLDNSTKHEESEFPLQNIHQPNQAPLVFKKTLVDSSAHKPANDKQVNLCKKSDDAVGTGNSSTQGTSTFEGLHARANLSGGLSFHPLFGHSGGNSQDMSPTKGLLTNAQICDPNNKSTVEMYNLKGIQPEPSGSPASSGQGLVGVGGDKSTEKNKPGMDSSSIYATKEVNKNKCSNSSGDRQPGLNFLYI